MGAYSVVGQLIRDGTIEVLQLDPELGWPDTPDNDVDD